MLCWEVLAPFLSKIAKAENTGLCDVCFALLLLLVHSLDPQGDLCRNLVVALQWQNWLLNKSEAVLAPIL